MNNDQKLRRLFEALKSDEQRQAPPFAHLFCLSPSRAPRRFPRLAAATALLLMVVAVPIAVRRWSVRVEQPPNATLSSWRAPTDFLLTTPNVSLLRSLPEIGTTSIPLTQGVSQ
jgi:hypothetical protein